MDGHADDAGAVVVAGIGGVFKCLRDKLNLREWAAVILAAVIVGYAAYGGAMRLCPQWSYGEHLLVAMLGGLLSGGVIVFAIRLAEYLSERAFAWTKGVIDTRLPLPQPTGVPATNGRHGHDPAQPDPEPVGPAVGPAPQPRVPGDGNSGVLRPAGGA